jgi:hypothetical protein
MPVQVGNDGQIVDDIAQRRGLDEEDAHESRNYPGLSRGWDIPVSAFFDAFPGRGSSWRSEGFNRSHERGMRYPPLCASLSAAAPA